MANHLLFFVAIAVILAFSSGQDIRCTANTFKVIGNGQVDILPDIVKVTISATGNGATPALALADLNNQITALINIFTNLGIPTANYSTTSININQVYNYSNNPANIIGAQAIETLLVTLGGSAILDSLLQSFISININIQSLQFDLSDRASALQKARVAAFTDAKTKFG